MTKQTQTQIFGRRLVNGIITISEVGKLFSTHALESGDFEIVEFQFLPDYRGIPSKNNNQGQSVLTYVKTIVGAYRDIVSPIVTLETAYTKSEIYCLISGQIVKVQAPAMKKNVVAGDGSVLIMVITASEDPSSVIEWSMKFPSNIRFDRKIVHIKRFDLYFGGVSIEQMQEIRDGNVLISASTNVPKPLVDISARGNVDGVSSIFFNMNGIPGRVMLEKTTEPVTTVTVRVGGLTLSEIINNKSLLSMSASIYKIWNVFDTVELLLDIDEDRLSATYDKIRSSRDVPIDAAAIVNELRSKNNELSAELSNKESEIGDMCKKLADLEIEYNLKLQQETHKTRREEIKFQGTIADQRISVVMDTIKLGGALLGVLSIIITMASKMSSSKQSVATIKGLTEWAVAMLL